MNKSLLSITAAAALIMASGAAAADSGNVEIYGTLNVDFENAKATGGTAAQALPAGHAGTAPSGVVQPDRNRVTSNSSNIGFRGFEELGFGLKAIWQVETGLSMDAGSSTPTTATSAASFWASRNSNIGLSSAKLGTLFYGQWDTPYKSLTNIATFDPFYGTGIASDNAVIGTPGFNVATTTASGRIAQAGATTASSPTSISATGVVTGASAAGDASFDRRQGNSVQYWTPNWSGFSARLAYSANEQRTNEPTAANGNPVIYSGSVRYEYGPLVAAYSFEQHRDYFGLSQLGGAVVATATNKTARDNGQKATLTYHAWNTYFNAAWEQLVYNNSDTVLGNLIQYNRNLAYFSAISMWGPNTFRLGFGNAWAGSCSRAGNTSCSASGLDARHYALGYSYSFSKRTDVYALWTKVNNGAFATYQLGNGAGLGAAAGSHNQGFGLGIRHVF